MDSAIKTFNSLKIGAIFVQYGRDCDDKDNGNRYHWKKVSKNFGLLINFKSPNKHLESYFEKYIGKKRQKMTGQSIKIDEVKENNHELWNN